MKPIIDESEWPILVVRWPNELTLAEVDEHFEEMLALALRGGPIAVLVDMTGAGIPPAHHRQHAAKKLAEVYAESGDRIAGVAHVIRSPLVRGVLTAVYWVSAPPFPKEVFGTRAEALDWCRSRLPSSLTKSQRPER